MRSILAPVAFALAMILAGCSSIGPATVARDRFEYSASIGESWKRQTLLNIVKLRYLDPPIFVDVGQIVAGYTLETSVNAVGWAENANYHAELSGRGTYTDRPTITYTPLTGNKFIKSLMTPLTPESVFFMIQSGWPADAVLFATTASINGLKNQESTVNGATPPDPDFVKMLSLMRKVQLSGGVALRIQVDAEKQQTTILSFRRQDVAPQTLADAAELRRLLRLDPNASEFKLVFGSNATSDKEVAMQTRSIIQLMQTMAAQVDVPDLDLTQTRVAPGWESIGDTEGTPRMVEIHNSEKSPSNAFVTVNYRDHWFWIDDRDLKSKRVFAFMMMLFTLAEPGEREPLPLITIPAR